MGLPRQHRLLQKAAFQTVLGSGEASYDPVVKVIAHLNDCGMHRLGLAVSRRVDPRAVQRNRIKRVTRESFRRMLDQSSGYASADFVVLPRRDAVTISNRELTERLDKHWRRLFRKLGAQSAESHSIIQQSAPGHLT